VSFLRLVEKLTQGSRLEISYSGTSLLFHPGTIQGGQVTHQCPDDRAIGWFLEPLLAIAPFGKKDLALTLRGVTTDGRDASVDTIRTSGLPHLAMFLDTEGVELRVRCSLPLPFSPLLQPADMCALRARFHRSRSAGTLLSAAER